MIVNLPAGLECLEIAAPDMLEILTGRVREAIAILETVVDGDMLCALPEACEARRKHQHAVSLLSVLRRELNGVVDELEFAQSINL